MGASGQRGVVHAKAPGKINVYLRVGELGPDGYHEVASAYQAVSLSEELRVEHADGFELEVTGTVDLSTVPLDERNLALRAARLLAEATGYRGGVRIRVDKHVPVAGGMGGGSADAAAALIACDALWGTELHRDALFELAKKLGADVPFALSGGVAVGTGRGDELAPALAKGSFNWVLALSERGLSTPEVYAELDRHRAKHRADFRPVEDPPVVDQAVLQALRAGDAAMLAQVMHNDLQVAALHLAPELARVIELGEHNGALAGIVSGSGPTVAFLVEDADAALELQVALSAARLEVVRATGPVHGARILSD